VDGALAIGHDWLSDEELQTIEAARADVRHALEGKEAHRLKQAVQELDRATEALAAKIVEHAMEQASGWSD
jgi:hypothetical protein